MSSKKELLNKRGLLDLPVGYHKESEEMVPLASVIDQMNDLRPLSELDESQRKNLVIERWKAGGWSDLLSGHELITMDRAIKEVQENTELGQDLVKISLRAIEMMLEDLEEGH